MVNLSLEKLGSSHGNDRKSPPLACADPIC
jgi:hypothetical protein